LIAESQEMEKKDQASQSIKKGKKIINLRGNWGTSPPKNMLLKIKGGSMNKGDIVEKKVSKTAKKTQSESMTEESESGKKVPIKPVGANEVRPTGYDKVKKPKIK